MIFAIAFSIIFGCGVYYIWCSYHPEVSIGIVMGGQGEHLKVEMPSVTIGVRHGIQTAASEQLKILEFRQAYDRMNEYIIHNYKACDIKLDIKLEDDKTILKYTGTATDLNDVTNHFEQECILDFVLDADIS